MIQFNCSALVVDDDEDLREILEVTLVRLGLTVVTSADARVALNIIKARTFDLILSDISMPGMDGFSFLGSLIKQSLLGGTKFIFITGGVDTMDPRFSNLTGQFNGLLPKPFSQQVIIAKLSELFPDKTTIA